jgi:hypothetical protein
MGRKGQRLRVRRDSTPSAHKLRRRLHRHDERRSLRPVDARLVIGDRDRAACGALASGAVLLGFAVDWIRYGLARLQGAQGSPRRLRSSVQA